MNPTGRKGSEHTVDVTYHPTSLSCQPDLRGPQLRPWAYAGFIASLALAFYKPLYGLAIHAGTSDIHSHVLLIPLVSAYLIYLRRCELPKTYASSGVPALVAALLGITVLLVAGTLLKAGPPISRNDYLTLTTFSFLSFVVAGAFLFFGSRWIAAASFPLAFLAFMLPVPDGLLHALERASQMASSEAAAVFFTLTGTPVLRDGFIFQLPGISIEVAQECSGIRSSWVLFITTLAAGYLFLKSNWRRAVLVAFVIPLAVVRNGFRIWVIGILCVQLGPEMIDSFVHHHGGPLFFALSLIPLFLLLWGLRSRETKAHRRLAQMNTDGQDAARTLAPTAPGNSWPEKELANPTAPLKVPASSLAQDQP
jgi:exosortase C (VPDSG-CTERM-specific)